MSYNYQDYYAISKKKYKLKGALNLFLVEIVVLLIGGTVVWSNYGKLTKANSISEVYTQKHYVAAQNATKVFEADGVLSYSGYFGEIYLDKQTTNSGTVEFKSVTDVSLDINHINRVLYSKSLLDLGYIDQYGFDYLIAKNQKDFDIAINDFHLLGSIKNITLPLPNNQNKLVSSNIVQYLQDKEYKSLAYYLQNLDDEIKNKFLLKSDKNIFDVAFINTENFQYLMDKVDIDKNQFYASHITTASQLFNINPNLIKSVILTEQMRAAFTYRGRVKQIMATDTYLMVMSHSSYGIGGVKSVTATEFENYLQSNYSTVYDQYFAYKPGINKNNALFDRLTSTTNYQYQIYYIAGIMYQYIDTWRQSNIDISSLPGIVITLYNVGDRTPTTNPKIGGSSLNIEGQQYSFGKLGMFLYYYLDIY